MGDGLPVLAAFVLRYVAVSPACVDRLYGLVQLVGIRPELGLAASAPRPGAHAVDMRDALGESELREEERLHVLEYELLESLVLFRQYERLLVLGARLPSCAGAAPSLSDIAGPSLACIFMTSRSAFMLCPAFPITSGISAFARWMRKRMPRSSSVRSKRMCSGWSTMPPRSCRRNASSALMPELYHAMSLAESNRSRPG
jgi:hypothetical protein